MIHGMNWGRVGIGGGTVLYACAFPVRACVQMFTLVVGHPAALFSSVIERTSSSALVVLCMAVRACGDLSGGGEAAVMLVESCVVPWAATILCLHHLAVVVVAAW